MAWKKLLLSPLVAALAIIALATLLYGQVLSFRYVWDDHLLFLDKTALLNEPLSWQLLMEPILAGTSYMRPLVMLSFFTEFHVFGQSPMVSHLVNLIIFVANALLVFAICKYIASASGRGNGTMPALLAAVFYVVHPALVESAAWAAGRFDLMVTLFLLGAVLAYLRLRHRPVLMIATVSALMFLALLSKELGVVLPALVICVWCACYWDRGLSFTANARRAVVENYRLVLALVAVFLLYLLLRKSTMGGVYHSALSAEYFYNSLIVHQLPLASLRFYLEHTLLPFSAVGPHQPIDWNALHTSSTRLANLLVLAGTFITLALGMYRGWAAVWLFIAWLACISPVLHLIPLNISGNLGADRFLTAPLAFGAMAVALLLHDLGQRLRDMGSRLVRLPALVTAVWLALAVFTTYTVLPFWSSDLQLWAWAHHKHPDFGPARYNYFFGALTMNRADLIEEEAAKQIEQKGGLEVGDQILYANMLMRQGNPESMNYLEGIMYALPKFHEQPDGKRRSGQFLLPKMHMAGVYLDYSIGLMGFRGDAEAARKYNYIAEWYLQPSEKIILLYQRAAIFYALGEFDAANALVKELDALKYPNREGTRKGMIQVMGRYCDFHKYADPKGVCERLQKEGFFAALEKKA